MNHQYRVERMCKSFHTAVEKNPELFGPLLEFFDDISVPIMNTKEVLDFYNKLLEKYPKNEYEITHTMCKYTTGI